MLDGGGSVTGSSTSRRRIRHTAMLSSSMAVTCSLSAIHTGRKHYITAQHGQRHTPLQNTMTKCVEQVVFFSFQI